MARARRFVVEAQRSSSEPPPRARINTSHSARRPASFECRDDFARPPRALHGYGVNQDGHRRESAAQAHAGCRAPRRRWAR